MSPRLRRLFTLLAIVATCVPVSRGLTSDADAQELSGQTPRAASILDNWGYQSLYREGWSARRLLNDATVYGPGGDSLGRLENILLTPQGSILGFIVHVGGFFDLRETHVFVPWDEVVISSLRRVYIPVTEENVSDYAAAPLIMTRAMARRTQAVDEDVRTGRGIWKATDLISDYVYLDGRSEFGHVYDLVFSESGQLYSYVVNADPGWGGGFYALPYVAETAWDARRGLLHAPFGEMEVKKLGPFDYARINRRPDAEKNR